MTRFAPAAALCILASLSAAPAWAQIGGSDRAVSIRPKNAEDTLGPAKAGAPPALPGAQSSNNAAPATKSANDMSPNEALFDAINRGDVAAARDALSRGAELNGQNVLGMTPMELSVDLGRNDISFLLLSMRGETPRGGKPGSQGDAAALLSGKTQPAKGNDRKGAPIKVATAPVKAADRGPRLFANDGGAPVPAAGFLGFDTGRGVR